MTQRLAEAIREMSPEALAQLEDFAVFLKEHKPKPAEKPRYLSLSWAGSLSHLKDQYASGVDLAHDINRQRADDAVRSGK